MSVEELLAVLQGIVALLSVSAALHLVVRSKCVVGQSEEEEDSSLP